MMDKIMMVLLYLSAFWSTVVVNCAKPVNWKNCENPQEWILPEIQRGWRLYTGEETPYQEEQDVLQSLDE